MNYNIFSQTEGFTESFWTGVWGEGVAIVSITVVFFVIVSPLIKWLRSSIEEHISSIKHKDQEHIDSLKKMIERNNLKIDELEKEIKVCAEDRANIRAELKALQVKITI